VSKEIARHGGAGKGARRIGKGTAALVAPSVGAAIVTGLPSPADLLGSSGHLLLGKFLHCLRRECCD
jgi:hypothetical protein